MERIVFFVEQIALGLYVLCGVGALLGVRAYFLARRALAGAQFELEKEIERYRVANAITLVIGLLEVGLAVGAVAQIVAPTLRADPPHIAPMQQAEVVETPFLTAVPSGTPGAVVFEGVQIESVEDQLNLVPFATPTLTPTPVGTIIPDVPPAVGCDTPEATLVIPANGMVVFEATNVVGSANIENFAFYRFELNGPSTNNNWSIFRQYTTPVTDGELGQIVPALFIPGQYQFRLTVFDINSALQASCTVTMIISAPIPTPTPIRES